MNKNSNNQPKLGWRNINDLVDFPMQAAIYPDVSKQEDAALDEDIKENEQREPIHVLPENDAGFPVNTVLDGKRRSQSLRRIGKRKAKVLVRYDLAHADREAIEQEFLRFNLNRRQLSKLGKARVALRMYEIEKRRRPGKLNPGEEAEARERVGKVVGMSGRHLERYCRLLRTPIEIQAAFEDGQIPLILAEKVADLEDGAQREIVNLIREGQDPKVVVSKSIPPPEYRPKKHLGTIVGRLIKALDQANSELRGRAKKFSAPPEEGHVKVLKAARRDIDDLIVAFERNARRRDRALEKLNEED